MKFSVITAAYNQLPLLKKAKEQRYLMRGKRSFKNENSFRT
jgi:hypothetical protein